MKDAVVSDMYTNGTWVVTACVDGMVEPTMAFCDEDGTNDLVLNDDYDCNSGYYKSDAPLYCSRM